VGRRVLVVVALVLAAAATASGASARVDADPLVPQEWWLSRIGADQVAPPGPGVPLAIVDSGVDATHPEFAGRPNTTYLDQQTTFGREEYHGTFVASVAAAPENGTGIVGVYPQAALEIFDGSPDPIGISTSIINAGIRAVAQHCPAVINLSFGSTEQDPSLLEAIATAQHNGCLVVAATGNNAQDGSPPTFPASWPHVLGVGATDENDAVTSFSTVGPLVDVVAPGMDIVGAVPAWRSQTGYVQGNGTSYSAPLVSAAAAWVWTARPTLSATQLSELLRTSARDIGPAGVDGASGWGIVNIPAALTAPTPAVDPQEPNEDVDEIKPGALFRDGQPPLTTQARPTNRIAASLDANDDPRDLYRIWVPARRVVHVSVSSGGTAAARIWGPKTISTAEGIVARRRDLRGPAIAGGKKGSAAYVEVLLTGASAQSRYVLTVRAARR
jgi:subtilisin family serine protease